MRRSRGCARRSPPDTCPALWDVRPGETPCGSGPVHPDSSPGAASWRSPDAGLRRRKHMLGTDFRTGSPNWIDLGSPDTDAAAAFYGAVFGWQFVSAGPDAGGYGFFQKDGKTVGALGPLGEEGARSAWTTYFQSDDIQATVRDVAAGGGTVR